MEGDEKSIKLPYHFAKSNGIIVGDIKNHTALIYHLPNTSLQAFAEVKRLLQCNLNLKPVNETVFQQHLAHIYQSKSSILDAAEGMGEEMDLSQLASQLPMSEDLLANQDDAPIIRLSMPYSLRQSNTRLPIFTSKPTKIAYWCVIESMALYRKFWKFNAS